MLTRLHNVLIGVLALQIVLAIVVLSRGDQSSAKKPEPLLPSFDASKVEKLAVYSSAGDGASPAKPAVVLRKDGASWTVSSAFDYPVAEHKASELLESIGKLKVTDPIATQQTRHKQLRVADDDFERKLVLTIDGKDQTLFVGGSAGARRTAVRLGGDANVYAVSGLTAYSIGDAPREWVDASYLNVDKADVEKVTIAKDGGPTVQLDRDGTAWKAAIDGTPIALADGETLDTAAIDRIVGDATSIDLAAPADPKRDASKPTATITLAKKASGTTSPAPVIVDVIADGTAYWVHDRSSPRAVTVDKSRLSDVVEVARDKLVKAPDKKSDKAKPGEKPATDKPGAKPADHAAPKPAPTATKPAAPAAKPADHPKPHAG